MEATAAEKRVKEMERHTALVAAAQEAIQTLEEPYAPGEFMPGTIEDAIEILRQALKP